jgi:hypothetical protein
MADVGHLSWQLPHSSHKNGLNGPPVRQKMGLGALASGPIFLERNSPAYGTCRPAEPEWEKPVGSRYRMDALQTFLRNLFTAGVQTRR